MHEALLGAEAAGVEGKRGGAWAGTAVAGASVFEGREGVASGEGALALQGGCSGDDALEAMDFLADFGSAASGLALSLGRREVEAGEDVLSFLRAAGADAFVGHDSGGVEG